MNHRMGWLRVAGWTALTALGVLLASGLHFPGDFGTRFWGLVQPNWFGGVVGFVFGSVSGLFIGGLPALLLPGLGVRARRWLGYNVLAFGLIHAVADALPYRPLVIWGGGPLLAVCQFLALRSTLTRPIVWLAVVTTAWWLGFGLTAGSTGYNLLIIGPLLGAVTGLLLRWLLVPAISEVQGSSQGRLARTAIATGLIVVATVLIVVFAGLTGLTGWFQ